MECWSEPTLDAKQYSQVLVSRIVISLAPPKGDGAANTVDPNDLKTLTDYFHDSMVKALKPQMQVVDKPGAGVVVMRIALTELSPTRVSESLAGRFEIIPVPHWPLGEMQEAFGWNLEQYIYHGAYPGAAPLIGEPAGELERRLERGSRSVWLAQRVPPELTCMKLGQAVLI